MHRLILIAAVVATTVILPVAANAASTKVHMNAYRNFSRAQFINICARACHSPGGNRAVCCACNGGDWTGKFCT
jgi:hypothetical protein